jgi:5-methyltetrahydropteroyltriglutamate--homocysteine methyltransferase
MKATNLGFPRIGKNRELKKAVEAYWSGKLGRADLLRVCQELRAANWRTQQELGIEHIPSNDFSLYDQMLDTTAMVGAIPARFVAGGQSIDLDTYFAMARGTAAGDGGQSVAAMEMTKWFDTNYHYIVPELTEDQQFHLASRKPIEEFQEAKRLGITTRPVLIGPLTYLQLAKCVGKPFDRLQLLDGVIPIYEQVLQQLREAGAEWVQIDEPCLVLDLPENVQAAFLPTYERFSKAASGVRLLVATYFGDLRDNLETACRLPVHALHVDLVAGEGQLDAVLRQLPQRMTLSAGVIDGRNIWRADLDRALDLVRRSATALGSDRVLVAPSCSLLHVPLDLKREAALSLEIASWLAFAEQKVNEVATLARTISGGAEASDLEFIASRRAIASRRLSDVVHDSAVQGRLKKLTAEMQRRCSPFKRRRTAQAEQLRLPLLPTTTIGSFPQTKDVRAARADYKAGRSTAAAYEAFLESQIADAIRIQEELDLDVLVHGESERNDMVEYFGEQLQGFAFTQHGWVQSYGTRCVKPPIIYGDVSRPAPMTVRWIEYAQSQTDRPVKGMLTGPVTILQWSFVRNDQPRSQTCRQIALAIRDEVADLEAAGIKIIQIDEAALREGLPLRRADWAGYLAWAVECFKLTSSGVRDETQIHTHMCYSEFNDIVGAIAEMDADVISIEASRSRMELLHAFEEFRYPNEIGPGVYDIHSPRVPSREEMLGLLRVASQVFSPEQLWVNPDCGLKTRGWPEVRQSLENMVHAARQLREELAPVG